jgi:hypothetical protein
MLLATAAVFVSTGALRSESRRELRSRAAGAAQTQTPAEAASPVLTVQDKDLLAEALRLRKVLGDEVWPGLGPATIPEIIYNDRFEFLVGAAGLPPPPWARVDDDEFWGRRYYRRPASNPQAFAVKVGREWAGSMTSRDTMNRKAPFKLPPDFYVVALLHEVFHAFQAVRAPRLFDRALKSYTLEKIYPADDPAFKKAWTEEGELLARALRAPDRAGLVAAMWEFL